MAAEGAGVAPEAVVPPRPPRIILAASGSVAAVKVPELALQLRDGLRGAGGTRAQVRVVLTEPAHHFFSVCAPSYAPESWHDFSAAEPPFEVLRDRDEWTFERLGDPVPHIELRAWADVMVVAPCSANTLAKLAQGLCDTLLSCVARAWDFQKPLVVCPAMNTCMWDHPATAQHLGVLRGWGCRVVEPVVKLLACKDMGKGALAPVEDIVAVVREALAPPGGGG